MNEEGALKRESADPEKTLCRRCKELRDAARALTEAASSAMPAHEVAARLQVVVDLREVIEHETKQFTEARGATGWPKACLLADARRYLREARQSFAAGAREIERALEETRDARAGLRRAREVVETYSTALGATRT